MWKQPLKEQIGSKIDKVFFQGNVKDTGEIDCKFLLRCHLQFCIYFLLVLASQSISHTIGTKTLTYIAYPCKLDGVAGHIILENKSDTLIAPQVSFVPISGIKEHLVWPLDDIVEIKKVRFAVHSTVLPSILPIFCFLPCSFFLVGSCVPCVVLSLRKLYQRKFVTEERADELQSYVSMTRIALGWASGADIEGLGLTIRFKSKEQMLMDQNKSDDEKRTDGTTLHFKRVGRREQLFVRLISMGAQRWEVL